MSIRTLATIILFFFTFPTPGLTLESQNTKEPGNPEKAQVTKEASKNQDQYYPVALSIENDVINNTDHGYTNGFTLSISTPWTRQDQISKMDFIYRLTDRCSLVKRDHRRRRTSFALIHNTYTPSDLKLTSLIDDDLPYSGALLGQVLVDYQNKSRSEAMGIILGMIGPSAQAEWVQTGGHKMVGADAPEGWDNQIEDEMLVNLNYMHKWHVYNSPLTSGLGFDITPYAGASAGNLLTDLKSGLIVRIGNHDPDSPSTFYKGRLGSLPDIGYKPIPFTCFLMAGLEGSYTLYSILLDGNTVKNSNHVTRRPEVAAFFTGVGLGWEKFRVGLFWIRETKRFEEQEQNYSYGSITLGWLY